MMPRPSKSNAVQGRWPVLFAAAAIVLTGLIVYANSFQGEFAFDDKEAIKDNPTIRHLSPLKDVLFPRIHVNTVDGRPLLNLSFALNYAVHGLDVRGYHAVNLAVHLLAGLALFEIVRRTMLLPIHRNQVGNASWGLALVIALIWVVHPLQTESVTGICQRAESLMGLFYLLTFYLSIRSFISETPWRWQVAAVATCVLGMTTKEVMATAPVLVFLYDSLFVAGSIKRALAARWKFHLGLMLPWGILAALMLTTRGWSLGVLKSLVSGLGSQPDTTIGGGEINWRDYALTQFVAIAHYLRLSIWPKPLILDYGSDVVTEFGKIAAPAMIVGLLLAGTLWAFRRQRWIGFAGAWFFLILAPTSSVVPLPGQTIAEHRMYLSLAGLIVVLVIGAYAGWQTFLRVIPKNNGLRNLLRWIVPASSAVAVLFVLGGITRARNADYQTELSIMLDTVRKRPTNSRAHNNLGYAFAEQGNSAEAVRHYERAIELKPDYADAHNNLGTQLTAQGKPNEAVQHFERAIQIRPHYANAHNNLGGVLAGQGRLEKATRHFEMAVQFEPYNAIAHSNLGNALTAQGKLPEAIRHYKMALQINPNYPEAQTNLGEALTKQGRMSEALQHFQLALNLANAQGKAALADTIGQWIKYCQTVSPSEPPR